jgi:hypothetical protein
MIATQMESKTIFCMKSKRTWCDRYVDPWWNNLDLDFMRLEKIKINEEYVIIFQRS